MHKDEKCNQDNQDLGEIRTTRIYDILQNSILQYSIVYSTLLIIIIINNNNDKHDTNTDADLVGLRFEGLVGAWNLKLFGCP